MPNEVAERRWDANMDDADEPRAERSLNRLRRVSGSKRLRVLG